MDMRENFWRQQLSFYRFTTPLQTRYADMDTERHVNNVAVIGLHLEARSRFHLELLGPDNWLAQTSTIRTARFDNDFLRITHYPAAITAGVNLMGISERDYTLAVGLFQEDTCVGLHECRMGAWADGKQINLPAALHARLMEAGAVQEPA
jgi:acyl-CoA thioesterase FadM